MGEVSGNGMVGRIRAGVQVKMGCKLLEPECLSRLTETAQLVDELLKRAPDPAQPYVGKHAFAHKAGLHAAGVQADSQTFEHVDPTVVGNASDVLVSELSGRATIAEKVAEAKIQSSAGQTAAELSERVLDRVKALEHDGF